MVYRIPTHLESFVPPPAPPVPTNTQSALTHPWRGKFIVSGMRASDIGSNQEIGVTAVETDGETPPSSSHLWPSNLIFTIARPHALPILKQLQEYIKAATVRGNPVPLSTFMPERLRDPNANAVNQSMFRSLSRVLWDDQYVAVVPFSTHSPRVSSPQTHTASNNRSMGILIYPASNSSAILIGAVFLNPSEGFPDFVHAAQRQHHSHPSPPSHQAQSPQVSIPSQQGYPHYGMTSGSRGRDEVPISPTVINSRSNMQRQQLIPYPSTSRQRSASESFRHSSPITSYGHGLERQSQSLSPTSENTGNVDIRQQFHQTPAHLVSTAGEQHHHPYRTTPASLIAPISAQSRTGYAPSERYTEGAYAQMNTTSSDSAPPAGQYNPEGRSPRSYPQANYPSSGHGSGSGSQSRSTYGS